MGSVSDPGGDVEYAERGREEGMSVEKMPQIGLKAVLRGIVLINE